MSFFKKAGLCLATLVLTVSLVGCGAQQTMYSNLADEASRQEVAQVLESSGISQSSVQQLMQWAASYNEILSGYTPQQGFVQLPAEGVDYSTALMDDGAADYGYQQSLNCRITAFHLLKEQITTAKTGSDQDLWLMFDMEALDTLPQLQLTQQQRADFTTVFSQVSVSGKLEQHIQAIEEAWKERNIQIGPEGVSLVCIYLHDPEWNSRFVGHAGVLVQTEDGLLFVEKYSALDPFQATKFASRKELKSYLLARKDLYGGPEELAPIVTENGVAM